MNNASFIDWDRSVCLCGEGLPHICAAVCVADDGRIDLVLVDPSVLGDDRSTYRPDTPTAPHEQAGPLPLEFVQRLTIARRRQQTPRCGRPTKTGRPCQTWVRRPGDACGWHRQNQRAHNTTTKGTPE